MAISSEYRHKGQRCQVHSNTSSSVRHPPSWFGDGESPKKQGPKTGILQEAAIRRLIQENSFWIPLPQLMQLLRFIQEVGFSRPGPSFSVPPRTNNCYIINLASDSSGGTCGNEYQIVKQLPVGQEQEIIPCYQMVPPIIWKCLFVFSSVFSHCFTDTVCRTHHFLQPLPQMQGQGAKASQVSLSGSPLFSVLVMDFLVYLLSMLCLLSQCTGRTHTHARTHT